MDLKKLESLEEKIRRAASLLRESKQESASLQKRLAARDAEIEELRARLEETEASCAGEEESRELELLRGERRDILARVDKMLAMLDEVEAYAGRQEDLLAAVENDD